MIVFGGYYKTQKSNHTWEYNIGLNKWKVLETYDELPPPRTDHSAVFHGGYMFVFGGSDEDNHKLNDFWRLNLKMNRWSEIKVNKNTPSPRSGHAVAMINDRMYLFGGIVGMT